MKKNLLKKLLMVSLAVVATAASLSAMGDAAGATGAAEAAEVAPEVAECPICHEDVARALLIQTGCPRTTTHTAVHEFCIKCLTEWIKTSGQTTCPLCRQQLSVKLLRGIDRYSWWPRMRQQYLRLNPDARAFLLFEVAIFAPHTALMLIPHEGIRFYFSVFCLLFAGLQALALL